MTEVYRSADRRWSIVRQNDRYVIYDDFLDGEEVWDCRTLDQLYRWMASVGLTAADFEETA